MIKLNKSIKTRDIISIVILIINITICIYIDSFIPKDKDIILGTSVALIVGAAIMGTAATIKAIDGKVQKDKAAKAATKKENELNQLEKNRQALINPFEDLTNEYENLTVATQAAEIQIEQADISLANTLDTLMATGAGAGGATALAQAALSSKRGVAASIEQQEVQNAKLRAQGAMDVQKLKATGEQWKWSQQEAREMQKLNRTQAQIDQQRAKEMAGQQQIASAMGDFAAVGGAIAGSGMGGGNQDPTKMATDEWMKAYNNFGGQ